MKFILRIRTSRSVTSSHVDRRSVTSLMAQRVMVTFHQTDRSMSCETNSESSTAQSIKSQLKFRLFVKRQREKRHEEYAVLIRLHDVSVVSRKITPVKSEFEKSAP